MKLAGMIVILVSAGSVGFRIAAALKRRCRLLQQLLAALGVLQNEIGFCGTPLPQAFALAAVASEGTVEALFSAMAREMDRRRWLTPAAALEQAWQEQPDLREEEALRQCLLALAASLGKYDRDSQLTALEAAKTRLADLLHAAEQERSVRSRTYEALGLCAGLALAILLI